MSAGGAVNQESIAPTTGSGARRLSCCAGVSALAFCVLVQAHDAQAAGRSKAGARTKAQKPAAAAASSGGDSLLAEGKRLMAARQYAKACPKIQESQRQAPAASKLVELAICHEKQGKTATAWREFNAVIRQGVGTDASSKTARSHLNDIEPRVSRLTVNGRPGVDTKAIHLTIDGLPIEDSAWGTPIPVDPGNHVIVASVGGEQQWSGRVSIGEYADQKTVEVPVGQAASSAQAQAAGKPEPTVEVTEKLEKPPLAEKAAEEDEPPRPSRPHRPATGYVMLGAGLVGIGVGTYFGLKAMSLRSKSDEKCLRGCTQEAVDYNNDAKTAAWGANIGIGVGALVFGIGSYLLLKPLSPIRKDTIEPEQKDEKSDSASIWLVPQIAPTSAGASFGGVW
jgi:hypothetical protein